MVNIKVKFGSISRRLGISSTTTWSEFETQLHTLFNIPQNVPIVTTYTDEDGDIITLSSDIELQEVLSNSSNNTIKFNLTTSNGNNFNNMFDRGRSIDTMIDEETFSLINGVSAIQIEESNNNNRHVTITDEEEIPGETSKKAAESTNNVTRNNSKVISDDDPEIIVIVATNPWSQRRRAHCSAQRFSGFNPYYYTFGERSRRGNTQSDPNNSGESNRFAASRSYGCGRRHRRNQQIPSEVVAEKVNVLNTMGFVDDNLEGLVKKYNGNLEYIIEVLLLNQRNGQKDENEIKKDNDDEQSMEVEENTPPYVL
ncbi:2531_t:CDS:1 [Funneliformis geosporum]|uniref:12993_t:CDS:1 n=1 Tax=Funneliformis geosporum TaxID=1117311 RepID=A0A9W4SFQ1_9GLOM|nr:12993_t:CDS:1 [Funneliformis geosporum]CAI2178487.1 2531_t:CDS:1 [Funneliformis geosporum]